MKFVTTNTDGTRVELNPMSDDEIIKALELCSKGECHTTECPVFRNTNGDDDCRTLLIESALKLINRLTIKNEALFNEKNRLLEDIKMLEVENKDIVIIRDGSNDGKIIEKGKIKYLSVKEIRAEAVKEFADALSNEFELQKNTAKNLGDLYRADGLKVALEILNRVSKERTGEN